MIFVVDSSDEERLNECVEELNNLLTQEKLAKVPLLVFANKQDLQLALEAELTLLSTSRFSVTEGGTWLAWHTSCRSPVVLRFSVCWKSRMPEWIWSVDLRRSATCLLVMWSFIRTLLR